MIVWDKKNVNIFRGYSMDNLLYKVHNTFEGSIEVPAQSGNICLGLDVGIPKICEESLGGW